MDSFRWHLGIWANLIIQLLFECHQCRYKSGIFNVCIFVNLLVSKTRDLKYEKYINICVCVCGGRPLIDVCKRDKGVSRGPDHFR